MATQDNQISDKRRRLFKALSAAPVVATLQPGEALANHSAYQCLSAGKDLPETCMGPLCDDSYAYAMLDCWDVKNGRTIEKNGSPVYDPYADPTHQYCDAVIVKFEGHFYDTKFPGSLTAIKFDGPDTYGKVHLKRWSDYHNDYVRCRTVDLEHRPFAALGYGVNGDTAFKVEGPYPKVKKRYDNHGITTSCMNSIPMHIAGTAKGRSTLTIG